MLLPYQKKMLELADHVSKGGKVMIKPRCNGRYNRNNVLLDDIYEKSNDEQRETLKRWIYAK